MTVPCNAEFMRKLLIDNSICSAGETDPNGTWPAFVESMPSTQPGLAVSGNRIATYTTTPILEPRFATGGFTEHPGFQIWVEASDARVCESKIKEITNVLDAVNATSVSITISAITTTKVFRSITRRSTIRVGDVTYGNLKRFALTVNGIYTFDWR